MNQNSDKLIVKIYRGMEQLVARRAHNPKVTGSSPVPATQPSRNAWLFLCSFSSSGSYPYLP